MIKTAKYTTVYNLTGMRMPVFLNTVSIRPKATKGSCRRPNCIIEQKAVHCLQKVCTSSVEDRARSTNKIHYLKGLNENWKKLG